MPADTSLAWRRHVAIVTVPRPYPSLSPPRHSDGPISVNNFLFINYLKNQTFHATSARSKTVPKPAWGIEKQAIVESIKRSVAKTMKNDEIRGVGRTEWIDQPN
jgi:hypothetical protein